MSRSFLTKFIFFSDQHVSLGISGLILGGHCIYALGTSENKMITIDKKYTFTRNGFTEFMIIDNNGHHYILNNSIWYWKWNSIEDWHKLKTSEDKHNDKILIKYYGWRVPIFGLFPNIILSNQSDILDTMSN